MAERKEIIHFCVKCGKGMKYKEKKMLYLYDIKEINRVDIEIERATKRFAINLCEKCADELENLIKEWKESR